MTVRTASCRCGQLRVTAHGEPVRISVCHCLDCQKRSGSAFATQVRFAAQAFSTERDPREFVHRGDGGKSTRSHFCAACGSTLFYRHDHAPETIAVALGAFDDPYVFAPTVSIWKERRYPWVEISGEHVEHID